MNDHHLDRAVDFLIAMRPNASGDKHQQHYTYRHELVSHMQVLAALRLAGFGRDPRTFRVDDLVKCQNPSCNWAGPVEHLKLRAGLQCCPACFKTEFERMP